MVPESHLLQTACCDLVAEVVRDAGSASLRVTGLSMLPAIRPGDVLQVEHQAPEELRPGQIILYSRNGKLTAHRIVSIAGGYFLTRGDRLPTCDLPVRSREVIGRVESIRRKARTVSPDLSFWQHLAALVLRHSEGCTKLFLRLNSRSQRTAAPEATFKY